MGNGPNTDIDTTPQASAMYLYIWLLKYIDIQIPDPNDSRVVITSNVTTRRAKLSMILFTWMRSNFHYNLVGQESI